MDILFGRPTFHEKSNVTTMFTQCLYKVATEHIFNSKGDATCLRHGDGYGFGMFFSLSLCPAVGLHKT